MVKRNLMMKNWFGMIKNILKKDWPSVFICIVLAILVVFAIYCRKSETDWISNTILALTAFVLLWYTRETAAMKALVAKQNRLQTRPILVMLLCEGSNPYLKNEGKGPAVNARVAKFTIECSFRTNTVSTKKEYEFLLPVYIPQDSTCEFKMFGINKESGIRGTISEPNVITEIGKVITIKISYEDIEGTLYVSHFQIQSGRMKSVSLTSE